MGFFVTQAKPVDALAKAVDASKGTDVKIHAFDDIVSEGSVHATLAEMNELKMPEIAGKIVDLYDEVARIYSLERSVI